MYTKILVRSKKKLPPEIASLLKGLGAFWCTHAKLWDCPAKAASLVKTIDAHIRVVKIPDLKETPIMQKFVRLLDQSRKEELELRKQIDAYEKCVRPKKPYHISCYLDFPFKETNDPALFEIEEKFHKKLIEISKLRKEIRDIYSELEIKGDDL